MKYCIIFNCENLNNFSDNQINRICVSDKNSDFFVFYKTGFSKSIFKSKITFIKNENYSNSNFNFIENYIIENNLDYEYFYFIDEYTFFSGDYLDLFLDLNNDNADLLCSYIKKWETTNYTGNWLWIKNYLKKYPETTFKYMYKSCLNFFRISKRGLQAIYDCKDEIKTLNSELYYPTIIGNNEYKIKSLSSMKEDDEEFYLYNYTNPKTFYFNVKFSSVDELMNFNKSNFKDRNMIYNKFDDSENKSYINFISNRSYDSVDISVVMPVYNSEKYLREAIDSILNQIDAPSFEFLIIDDGSSDNSAEIINSYNDNRIVYINKKHSGIVDSLNLGIKLARGKYIVRMDSDDRSYFDRLRYQFDKMESDSTIDIMSCSMEWGNGKEEPEYCILPNKVITINNLIQGNCLSHPCVIMRKSSLDKLPFLYQNYFIYAEDYKLWMTAVKHGLKVVSDSHVVLWYRQSSEQTVNKKYNEMLNSTNLAKKCYDLSENTKYFLNRNKKLTIIITFKNEGAEIERTVENIRCTSEAINIILINDGSTDDYDYKWVANNFYCEYYVNENSLGVAKCRDFGVSKVKTPYFLLLDGHMRFYETDWAEKLIDTLYIYGNTSILCSESISIWKTDEGIYENENGKNKTSNYAAYVNMSEPGFEYTSKWTHRCFNEKYKNNEIIPVPSVLGAVYASSVKWWNYIGGLNGLIVYGQDEPYMSIKTWLLGGQVLLMKNWHVGHLYRSKHPYPVPGNKVYTNSIYLNNLFAETENKAYEYNMGLKKRLGTSCYEKCVEYFNERKEDFEKEKEYIRKNQVRSINWFYDFNKKCFY